MARGALESLKREQAYLAGQGHKGPLPPAVLLAISGGGDDGAFGAGLLNGWTAAGNRPVFKLVTGVSTGALTAPFAFAGPAYDATLKELYTTISAKDIAESRNMVSALTSDAMADNAPLSRLIAKYVDQQLLDTIAVEYAKGRLLLVGTTDLDARRGVIWNLSKLAASHDPKALTLFRTLNVIMARGAGREHLDHEIRAAAHAASIGLGPIADHQHIGLYHGIDGVIRLVGPGDTHVHRHDIGTAGLIAERLPELVVDLADDLLMIERRRGRHQIGDAVDRVLPASLHEFRKLVR